MGIYKGADRIDTVTVTGNTYTRQFTDIALYSAYMTAYSDTSLADSNWVGWQVNDLSAELSVNQSTVCVDNPVQLTFGGYNHGVYTLGIYKNNERFDTVIVEGSTYVRSFSEPGNYSAYMTAYNNSSYTASADSNWVYWEVKNPTAELSVNKNYLLCGDSVTLTFSGFNHGVYTLGIYKNNERFDTVIVEGSTYVRSFSEPGNYSAYMTAYNNSSYTASVDSNWVYWEVKNPTTEPPTNVSVATNKTLYNINEPVVFSFNSSVSSDVRDLFIYYPDGSQKAFTNQGTSFSMAFSSPGDYQALMQAWNDVGSTCTEKIKFSVLSPIPSVKATVKANATDYIVDTSLLYIPSCSVLVAGYKNHQLINIKIMRNVENDCSTTLSGDIDEIKVMAWDSLGALTPLCEAETILESEFITE